MTESQHMSSATQEAQAQSPSQTPEKFEAVYLQQATKEFADDLEKLRVAGDFKPDKSVPILIEALKQGASCYSTAEKQSVVSRDSMLQAEDKP